MFHSVRGVPCAKMERFEGFYPGEYAGNFKREHQTRAKLIVLPFYKKLFIEINQV
jgi:hypothetical protein